MTRDNLIVPILEGEEADNVVTPGKKWLLKLNYSEKATKISQFLIRLCLVSSKTFRIFVAFSVKLRQSSIS